MMMEGKSKPKGKGQMAKGAGLVVKRDHEAKKRGLNG
jgi:hypothetical protein